MTTHPKRIAQFAALIGISFLSVPQQATGEEGISGKSAVLKAIDAVGGRGLFRSSVEIQVTTNGDTVRVLFRRPVSRVMVAAGRLKTIDLMEMVFDGPKLTTKILDEKAVNVPFDKKYTAPLDQAYAKAIYAACTEVWRSKDFDAKEVALNATKSEEGYSVTITYIPYTPDAFSTISVSKNFKAERRGR